MFFRVLEKTFGNKLGILTKWFHLYYVHNVLVDQNIGSVQFVSPPTHTWEDQWLGDQCKSATRSKGCGSQLNNWNLKGKKIIHSVRSRCFSLVSDVTCFAQLCLLQYTCDAIYIIYMYTVAIASPVFILLLVWFCSAARFVRRQATFSFFSWFRLGGFWVAMHLRN